MTYEYECKACGHHWEAEQKITEEPLKECPSCNKPEAKRLISGGYKRGAIYRGPGWYATGGY